MLFSLRKRLLTQAGPERRSLSRLLTGGGLFFLGMGLIYYAEYYYSQYHATNLLPGELIALAGLCFVVLGGGIAALGYIGLSLGRILRFIKNDN